MINVIQIVLHCISIKYKIRIEICMAHIRMYLKNKSTPICHDIWYFDVLWKYKVLHTYLTNRILFYKNYRWCIWSMGYFYRLFCKNKEELKIMMSCISWLHPFVMRMYSVTNYSNNDDTTIVAMLVFWQKMMNWENYYLFLW